MPPQPSCLSTESIYVNHTHITFMLSMHLVLERTIFRCCIKCLFLKIVKNSWAQTFARVFLDKVVSLQSTTSLKRWLRHHYFPANLNKFFKTAFLSFTFDLFWLLSKEILESGKQQFSKHFKILLVNQFKKHF